jgi:hypothetical protein
MENVVKQKGEGWPAFFVGLMIALSVMSAIVLIIAWLVWNYMKAAGV